MSDLVPSMPRALARSDSGMTSHRLVSKGLDGRFGVFRRSRAWIVEIALSMLLLSTLCVLLQFRLDAYKAEFYYDESSHYVSGLLARDYFASWHFNHPTEFLRDFASAYPLVGIGHWGPLWYGVEGVWMLIFGSSRSAILALSATVTVGTASLLYAIARRHFGRILGAFAAAAFLVSPITQLGSASVMLDGAVTVICLLAMLAWWRFVTRREWAFSLAFGLLASGGLLVKGNAGCLALLPPILLLLRRDWALAGRWSFWIPVPVVLLVAGPWYAFTYGQVAQGFRFGWGWNYSSVAVPANFMILLGALGPLLLPTSIAGAAIFFYRRRSGEENGLICTCIAMTSAILLFQSIVPAAIQARYLEPVLPPLVLIAAFAISRAMRTHIGTAACVVVIGLIALPSVLSVPKKGQFGLISASQQLWRHRVSGNPSVLIAADGGIESAAIAELAMHDPHRPSIFVIRGSRLLGAGGYNSEDYKPKFRSVADVMRAIDRYSIPLVLVQSGSIPPHWTHVEQVKQAVRSYPDRWVTLYKSAAAGGQVILYGVRGNEAKKIDRQKIRMLSGPHALEN